MGNGISKISVEQLEDFREVSGRMLAALEKSCDTLTQIREKQNLMHEKQNLMHANEETRLSQITEIRDGLNEVLGILRKIEANDDSVKLANSSFVGQVYAMSISFLSMLAAEYALTGKHFSFGLSFGISVAVTVAGTAMIVIGCKRFGFIR